MERVPLWPFALIAAAVIYAWHAEATRSRGAATSPAVPSPRVAFPALDSLIPELPRVTPLADLPLRCETEDVNGRRTVRLSAGGGSATLVLTLPPPAAGPPSGQRIEIGNSAVAFLGRASQGDDTADRIFLPAQITADDRVDGARFVAAVAAWLGVPGPEPPDAPGTLVPVRGTYDIETRVGGGLRLYFDLEFDLLPARFQLDLAIDGTRASLRDPGKQQQGALLDVLARALRDGRPSRRTRDDDLRFAAQGPLVGEVRPLGGRVDVGQHAWIGNVLVGEARGDPERLVAWTEPASEHRVLGDVGGRVVQFDALPHGRIGVLCVRTARRRGYSSDEPAIVHVATVEPPTVRTLAESDATVQFDWLWRPAWSPDGTLLAIEGSVGSPPTRRSIVRIVAIDSGGTVRETSPDDDLHGPRWVAGQLVLRHSYEVGGSLLRWDLASGRLLPFTGPLEGDESMIPMSRQRHGEPPPGAEVPDLSFDGRALVIRIAGRERRFAARTDAEARALDDGRGLFWIGPRRIVLRLDDPVALDLETLELRYVFPTPGPEIEDASADGRWITARDAAGELIWGEVR